jgi:XTP/dITP diphosphohydrolase
MADGGSTDGPAAPSAMAGGSTGRPECSALELAAATVDRLRSPGGCPWDAEQSHLSLAPYLIEECYEVLDAIETEDPVALREELGDLLFQVLFHARLAQELPVEVRFTIEDVAADLTSKLERRHPHVFGDAEVSGSGQVLDNWDTIKKAEKQRSSAVDGVVLAQPALALAAKLIARSRRAGLSVAVPTGDGLGQRLFAMVAEAVGHGIDPELALREAAREFAAQVRTAEGDQAVLGE